MADHRMCWGQRAPIWDGVRTRAGGGEESGGGEGAGCTADYWKRPIQGGRDVILDVGRPQVVALSVAMEQVG